MSTVVYESFDVGPAGAAIPQLGAGSQFVSNATYDSDSRTGLAARITASRAIGPVISGGIAKFQKLATGGVPVEVGYWFKMPELDTYQTESINIIGLGTAYTTGDTDRVNAYMATAEMDLFGKYHAPPGGTDIASSATLSCGGSDTAFDPSPLIGQWLRFSLKFTGGDPGTAGGAHGISASVITAGGATVAAVTGTTTLAAGLQLATVSVDAELTITPTWFGSASMVVDDYYYVTATPPIVRKHPRDDGLGYSPTPRIFPPPKGTRIAGGYQ